MRLFLLSLVDILGEKDAQRLDSDERLKLKVKGTGLTLRELMGRAVEACEKAVAVRSPLDKRGAWLACMDELLGRAIALLNNGARPDDPSFAAEVDGAGVTLREAVAPFIEACRRTTVKTVDDEWENTRRCAIDAMLVVKLRLRELFS